MQPENIGFEECEHGRVVRSAIRETQMPVDSPKSGECQKNNCDSNISKSSKSNVMDGDSEKNKCFTNPNSRPICPDLAKEIISTSEKLDSQQENCNRDTTPKCACPINKTEIPAECFKSNLDETSKQSKNNSESQSMTSSQESIRIDFPNPFGENTPKSQGPAATFKPKSVIEAHPETMSTIKCAMQCLVCKVCSTTSEAASAAVTLLQAEGAKQYDNLMKYTHKADTNQKTCRRPDPPPKNCSNEEPIQKQILDTIMKGVDSAVSLAYVAYNNLCTCTNDINNCSSKYDVPNPNLHVKNDKNPPKRCEYTPAPSGSFFTNIKNRIIAMFSTVGIVQDNVPNDSLDLELTLPDIIPSESDISISSELLLTTDSNINDEMGNFLE